MADDLAETPEIKVEKTGLKIVKDMDYETWSHYISRALNRRQQALDYVERVSLWIIGDLYVYGEDTFGEDEAVQVADQYSAETIRKARWVSRMIPKEEREPLLSFTHHEVIAKKEPEERQQLLEQARDNEWSVYELKKYIRKGPKGAGSGKGAGNNAQGSVNDVFVCPECGHEGTYHDFRNSQK